ncbi:hypothetical protein C8Q74DRAFT_322731 [Fomes fomentarius]|nr:hypothetical protein C8Q74DRAFT_320421 [Fomes fomentarius]KAI0755794.1 hypothetical protein C8Q74DRAFT_322731 [Fomes fomentarius]
MTPSSSSYGSCRHSNSNTSLLQQTCSTTLHVHPLIVCIVRRARLRFPLAFTPYARTVLDRVTHSGIASHTLAQAVTDTPTPVGARLILRSQRISWLFVASTSILNTLRRDLGFPTLQSCACIPPVGSYQLCLCRQRLHDQMLAYKAAPQRTTRTHLLGSISLICQSWSRLLPPQRGTATFPANGRRTQPASSSDILVHILPDRLRPLLEHQKPALLKSVYHQGAHNDRLAICGIAWQLAQQTGTSGCTPMQTSIRTGNR